MKGDICMKKRIALLLACLMALSCVSALAEYDHIDFTINSTHSNASMDYNSDGMYKYISEMFNFDYEVYPVSKDSQSEKIRTWINGGTMPDVVTWRNFDYQEYAIYAEQGLLAPLPEGWEETYPDLYQMVKVSGLYDKMHVDGLVYGIPHATFGRFSGMEKVVSNQTLYYRKDWVEKLGMEPFGDTVTLEQIEQLCRGAIDNDLAGNGNTLGFSTDSEYFSNFLMQFAEVDYDAFVRGENGYALGASDPKVTDWISFGHDWYEKGIVDPDFYLNSISDTTNKFTSGIAACMMHNGAISSYHGYKVTFDTSTGLSSDDCIGVAAMATNDGVAHTNEAANYWSVTFFSPTISPEKLDRILTIMNWCCTQDGQLTVVVGVPGETWEYDEEGNVRMLTQKDENGNYPSTPDLYNSYNIFRSLGILPDDYSFVNPSNEKLVVEQIKQVYAAKERGYIIPLDYDYEFFASDAKSQFSLNFPDEITRIILLKDADVSSEWNRFLDQNRAIWEPVVADLNAEFCK